MTCNYIGYEPANIKNVTIEKDKTCHVQIKMKPGNNLKVVEVVSSYKPLINADVKSFCTVTREEYQIMSSKNISSVTATTQEVYQSIRGSRGEGAAYYVDGQRAEEYKAIDENKFKKVKNDPLSTFSIDVDAASYSNARRFINKGYLPPKDAVRIEELINYFSYDYPDPKDNKPFSINTEVTVCPWNKSHQLVQKALKHLFQGFLFSVEATDKISNHFLMIYCVVLFVFMQN